MKILILGINGFIGSSLVRRILSDTDWEVRGLDLSDNNISELIPSDRFVFFQSDIALSEEWIQEQLAECDVVLPLVAIAQPKLYGEIPLRVFELDFEENLKIIRWATRTKTWVIFPSTSEIYGMSTDSIFSEETTNSVYGPTNRTRWIYASSKQLLDRLLVAHGKVDQLDYTIFRPFNWIGPRQDSLDMARRRRSRVVPQFLSNLIDGKPILLNDGGKQRRSFTDIADGIDALMAIMNHREKSTGKIFNIGNPSNNCSIRDLANIVIDVYIQITGQPKDGFPGVEDIESSRYYGSSSGFQDMENRVPDIKNIRKTLGWEPKVDLRASIEKCATHFIQQIGNSTS